MTYGLVIALPDKDVTGNNPDDAAIDTRENSLRIRINARTPRFGQLITTFSATPAINYSKLLLSIPLEQDYLPLFYFYYDATLSDRNVDRIYGRRFNMDVFGDLYFIALYENKVLNFYLKTTSAFSPGGVGDLTGLRVTFNYTIFTNEAV